MEHLEFRFAGKSDAAAPEGTGSIAGVVGSGNLEVMIEPEDLGGSCLAVVDTSIHRFEETWKQVLEDFVERHGLSNVRISISDGGATPAVVVLRLDQAIADFRRAS